MTAFLWGALAGCEFDIKGLEAPPVCGNGRLDTGEQCDDGNLMACDGCSPYCTEERCGNGRVECGEECDDGNTSNRDGCLEGCVAARCGDGYVWTGVEVCDPGAAALPAGADCVAQGFAGGELACEADCFGFDTNGCTTVDSGGCLGDDECESGVCLTELNDGWPAGFCTRECDAVTPCSGGWSCVFIAGGRFCVEPCAETAECRKGYYCALDPWEGAELVCLPHCESADDCPDTAQCNAWTGRCNAPVAASDGDNGAPCDRSDSCKGACWDAQQGGYCVSPCASSTGMCPGDGVCSDVGASAWGDVGYCLDGCTTSTDCVRPGYTCQPSSYGPGLVCLPATE